MATKKTASTKKQTPIVLTETEKVLNPVTKEIVDANCKVSKLRDSLTQAWALIVSVCLSEGIDIPVTFRRGFKTIFEAYCNKNPFNYEG